MLHTGYRDGGGFGGRDDLRFHAVEQPVRDIGGYLVADVADDPVTTMPATGSAQAHPTATPISPTIAPAEDIASATNAWRRPPWSRSGSVGPPPDCSAPQVDCLQCPLPRQRCPSRRGPCRRDAAAYGRFQNRRPARCPKSPVPHRFRRGLRRARSQGSRSVARWRNARNPTNTRALVERSDKLCSASPSSATDPDNSAIANSTSPVSASPPR